MPNFTKVSPGDRPSASLINKVIDEVNRLGKWRVGAGLQLTSNATGQTLSLRDGRGDRYGIIVANGGCGGVEAGGTPFNDARYWVVRAYVSNNGSACDAEVTFQKYSSSDTAHYELVPVTNIAEKTSDTHGLQVGTVVVYWQEYDLGSPPVPRYLMDHADDIGLPQYQFMVLGCPSQNVRGWMWVTAHSQ